MQLDEHKFPISVWIQKAALLETEKLYLSLKTSFMGFCGFSYDCENRTQKLRLELSYS